MIAMAFQNLKRSVMVIGLVIAMSSVVLAAGTVTQALTVHGYQTMYQKLVFTWTADSSNGSLPATPVDGSYMARLQGWYLFLAVTDPGATAPTDNYDITVTDSYGVDLVAGMLADRDTATSEQIFPVPRLVDTTLVMTITNNAVNSAVGTLVLYFAR